MSGFQSPNYTQTPNDLFDELLPEMGLAELKVVMCIVRHTFGYHKDDVKMSIRAIARFTGLTANSVMEGAKQAEAHGLIERHMDGNKTTIWSAIVSVVPTKTRRISKRDAGVPPTDTLLGVKERETKQKDNDSLSEITKAANKSIDAYLQLMQAPGLKKMARVDAILSFIAVSLNINTETKRWKEFAEYVDTRQQKHGEKIDRFMAWVTGQKNFDVQFWPPSKMTEMWPRAFVTETVQAVKSFVDQPGQEWRKELNVS